MKKKVLIMMLAAGAVLALAGCQKDNEPEGPDDSVLTESVNLSESDETVADTGKKDSDYSSYWENHPVSFENCAWIINTDDGASLKYMNSGSDNLLSLKTEDGGMEYYAAGGSRYLSIEQQGEEKQQYKLSAASEDSDQSAFDLFETCQEKLQLENVFQRLTQSPILSYDRTVMVDGWNYDVLSAALDDPAVHQEDDLGTEENEVVRDLPTGEGTEDEEGLAYMEDNELTGLTCYINTGDNLLSYIKASYGSDSSAEIAISYDSTYPEIDADSYSSVSEEDFHAALQGYLERLK